MDCSDGRSIQIISFNIQSILSIIVDKEYRNASLPNVMDCRFGRSNHSYIQFQFNTSNHKRTMIEIERTASNCTDLNGL